MCYVHDDFHCIILLDEQKIRVSDPPFLNRFEKQIITFDNVLTEQHRKLAKLLKQWLKNLFRFSKLHQKIDLEIADVFLGYNEESLASLVLHHSSFTNSTEA